MKIFTKETKLFFQTKVLFYTLLLSVVGSLIYLIIGVRNGFFYHRGTISIIETFLFLAPIFFIVFIFLSYNYFTITKREGIDECFKVTKYGMFKLLSSQFLLLELFNTTITVFLILSNIFLAKHYDVFRSDFSLYIIRLYLLNTFLVNTLAILVGMLCSFFKRKSLSYIFIFLMIFLSSTYSEYLANYIYAINETTNIYPFTDLFYFYPRVFDKDLAVFAFPAQSYQFQLVGAWTALFFALVLIYILKNNKKLKTVAVTSCVIFSVILSGFYVQPVSRYSLSHDPVKGDMADLMFYGISDFDEGAKQYEEKADFNVTDYHMNLNVQRLLNAKVTLTVDRQNLGQYKFTMYHCYKIKSVTNQNDEELEYNQKDDYITVQPKGATKQLTFTYSGSCPKYYSNDQGIFLPTGFLFYPVSGYHMTYSVYAQGKMNVFLQQSTPITVSIESKNRVYCNLPETKEGSYCGASNSLVLFSGFYDERNVDGVKVIYPYLREDDTSEEVQNQLKTFIQNNKKDGSVKTIFIKPHTSSGAPDERCIISDDSVVIYGLLGLVDETQNAKISSMKRPLIIARQQIEYGCGETYDFAQKIQNKTLTDKEARQYQDNINYLFAQKVVSLGKEAAFEKCDEYISTDNTRTIKEFLASF